MEYKWRKLDNTAKLFSMDGINNTSIFRLSGILKEEIEPLILKKAVDIVLKDYKGFNSLSKEKSDITNKCYIVFYIIF